ncbi:MAG: sigma-54 interaction domain-containing protein, partial [Bryobacteraceae bacterium]
MLYNRPQKAERMGLGPGARTSIPDEVIFGKTPAMQRLRQQVGRLAGIDIPVLIQGQSGTGKGILAGEIHLRSPWHSGPFVPLNCAAIPANLLESELFGYEAGAFTGAHNLRIGWVQAAAGGTLFLDEIAELSLPLQAKLLHLLQDRRFCRIGGHEEVEVETRIICATNRDLEEEVQEGRFREDLLYRINTVTLYLPALTERRHDIPALVSYFLRIYSEQYGTRPRPLSATLMNLLLKYHWPGNIREMENLIKTYAVLDSEDVITSAIVERQPAPPPPEEPAEPSSLKEMARQATRDLERRLIEDALQANNWNRKATARVLNISYRSLFYKIRAAGLPPKKA